MLRRWTRIVFATTYNKFKYYWESFKERYSDPIFQLLIQYIQSEWIDNYPEQFLHFYTKHYLYLNKIATSRTEGAYQLLKQDLKVSTNNLLVVLQTFERVIKLQFQKIDNKIANQKIRRLAKKEIRLFKSLFQRVSFKAIQLTKNLYSRYLLEGEDKLPISPIYDCDSKETSGFLYIYLIQQYKKNEKSLEPYLYYQHQHLYNITAPPIDLLLLLRDPLYIRQRGRPRGARNFISQEGPSQQSIQSSLDPLTKDRSTQRDPSGFEYVLTQE